MPMKNQGSVPQGKNQKKANLAKDKATQRGFKELAAKTDKGKKEKNDPRDLGE